MSQYNEARPNIIRNFVPGCSGRIPGRMDSGELADLAARRFRRALCQTRGAGMAASLLNPLLSRAPMARSTRAYDFGLELLDLGAGQGVSSAYLNRRQPEASVFGLDVTMVCLKPGQSEAGPRPPFFIQVTASQARSRALCCSSSPAGRLEMPFPRIEVAISGEISYRSVLGGRGDL